MLYYWQADYKQTLKCLKTAQQILESFIEMNEATKIFYQAMVSFVMGAYYTRMGKYEISLELYQNNLRSFNEKIRWQTLRSFILNNMATIQRIKGDWNQAVIYYQEALTIFEEFGNQLFQMYPLINLGRIYHLQGDLQRSFKYTNQGLMFAKQLKNKRMMAAGYEVLGLINQSQGNLEESLQYFLKGLAILDEIKLKGYHDYVIIIYRLAYLNIEIGNQTEALKYHQMLLDLPSNEEDPDIAQYSLLIEAMIYKMSKKFKDKARAQELLKQIYEDPKITFQLRIRSMLLMCDLLIQEAKLSEETSLSIEIKEIINELTNLTENTQFTIEIINSLIIKAQLLLIEGDIEQSLTILEKAKEISEANDLINLKTKVIREREIIINEMSKWEGLIRQDASISERIQQARLEEYLEEAIKILQNREGFLSRT